MNAFTPKHAKTLDSILLQRCPPSREQLLWMKQMIQSSNVPSIMHDYRFGDFLKRWQETILEHMKVESEHCADIAMFIAMERAAERRAAYG